MSLIAPKFASVVKQKKIGTISAQLAVRLSEKGKTMMDEYDKCRYCTKYDNYDGCQDWFCFNKDSFKPDKRKIIEKSQESGLSVADIVSLIELE